MLQSHTVYSNVSKGVLAKSKDLGQAFGTDDQTKVCLEVSMFCLCICDCRDRNFLSNHFKSRDYFLYVYFMLSSIPRFGHTLILWIGSKVCGVL